MVLNQKIPERKNWSQSIHYNGSKPKNYWKEKIDIANTIMVLNQKIPERKNWSQNIYYNGSKPENTRKRNWSKSIHYNGSKPENTRKEKIGHKAYTIMVPNQKIPERKKFVTEHTL